MVQPVRFGGECLRFAPKRSENWTSGGGEISRPLTIGRRLDMRGATNRQSPESVEFNRFAIEASDLAIGIDFELHERFLNWSVG